MKIRIDSVIKRLLYQDALAYGGFSAGVMMLQPTLQGVEFVDDPNKVPEGYDVPVVWEGVNVLPFWIALHYKSRHREMANGIDSAIELYRRKEMPFRTLRDGQVLIIEGRHEDVVS